MDTDGGKEAEIILMAVGRQKLRGFFAQLFLERLVALGPQFKESTMVKLLNLSSTQNSGRILHEHFFWKTLSSPCSPCILALLLLPKNDGSCIIVGRNSRMYRIKPREQSQASSGFIKVKEKEYTPKIMGVGRPGKKGNFHEEQRGLEFYSNEGMKYSGMAS